MSILRAPLDYVDNYQRTTSELLDVLRKRTEQIQRMLLSEEELQRTVAPLKFIRTMYRVESATLGNEVQSMFLALTEEIQTLQQQVNQTFAAKFDILRANQRSMDALIRRLNQQTNEQGALMKQKRSYISKAVQDLNQDLEINRKKDIKLTQVTNRISSEVVKLVFSLQAQDVVAQKIAHVLSALDGMERQANSDLRSDEPDKQNASILYLYQAAGVEAAQLKAVAENLRQTDTALCGSLDVILGQVKALDLDCVSLTEFDQVTVGASGLVQTLLDSLSEVQSMVEGAVASAKDAFDAIRPMGGQASNVTAVMRDLSARIKLIALNAQVQAAHIKSGTGLEVLAAQTADIANVIGNISSGIAEELDAFTKHLDQLVETFGNLYETGTAGHQQWLVEFRAQEKELHTYRDEALSELTHIGSASDRLRKLAHNMRSRVQLKELADDRVELPSTTLLTLQEMMTPWVKDIPEHETKMAYTRSYTMESERLIHENVLTGKSDTLAGATDASQLGADRMKLVGAAENSGDLVLFDDFSSPSASDAAASPSPNETSPTEQTSSPDAGLAAGVNASTSSAPSTERSTTPATKLADNIELF
ncbi:MAG: hypothetical protein JNN07_16775 [Verrucomicrobiales bacterium]|nr:hypothetical protein [Verrucomicrobiales bacterium]